jgi:hypothetical protein
MLGTRGCYVWEIWTQIEHVLADPVFRKNVDGLLQTKRQEVEAPAWFQQNHSQRSLTCVAYFTMEFMLSEALPIYSGGLGNVGTSSPPTLQLPPALIVSLRPAILVSLYLALKPLSYSLRGVSIAFCGRGSSQQES